MWMESTIACCSARSAAGPGQHDLLDILDVNGRTLVILKTYFQGATSE